MTVKHPTSVYALNSRRLFHSLAQNVHWRSRGKSETEQIMCVKSRPTHAAIRIQTTLKKGITIHNI